MSSKSQHRQGWVSYQEDDSSFLADLLDTLEQNISASVRVEQLMAGKRAAPDLTNAGRCIIGHLAGYVVNKLIRFASICEKGKIVTDFNDHRRAGDIDHISERKSLRLVLFVFHPKKCAI